MLKIVINCHANWTSIKIKIRKNQSQNNFLGEIQAINICSLNNHLFCVSFCLAFGKYIPKEFPSHIRLM